MTRLAILVNNCKVDEIKTPFFNLQPRSLERYKDDWIARKAHYLGIRDTSIVKISTIDCKGEQNAE